MRQRENRLPKVSRRSRFALARVEMLESRELMATATQLVVTTEPPATVNASTPIQFVVTAEDAQGNVDTTYGGTVAASLVNNSSVSGAVLGGNTSVAASKGVATFSLQEYKPGSNFQVSLKDAANALPTVVTTAFTVTPFPANHLVISTAPPSSVQAGQPFGLTVEAEGYLGDVDTNYNGSLTLALAGPAGARLGGTTTLNFAGGVATASNLVVTQAGAGFQVVAQSAMLTSASSSAIAVTPAAAASIFAAVPASPLVVGSYAVTLYIDDSYYNSATGYTGTVHFSSSDAKAGLPANYTFTAADKGIHTFQVSFGTPGSQTLTVADVAGVLRPFTSTFQVNSAQTGLSLASSLPSVVPGQPVTLTAGVYRVTPGSGVATGSVSFYEGTTLLGTSAVNAAGQATLATSGLTLGTHLYYATYSGDTADQGARSFPAAVYAGNTARLDFEGDGKNDVAVYGVDPATGKYRYEILTSSTNFNPAKAIIFNNYGYGYGNAQSIPVPGDYFGDGRAAYALWTPNGSGGMTFTAVSSLTYKSITANFGGTNDVPVVADVDGDGKMDFGVYGYQAGLGYRFDFLLSSANFSTSSQQVFNNYGYGYGNASSTPVVGDFFGDGRAAYGLWTPNGSGGMTFSAVSSLNGRSISANFGQTTDTPIVADVNGDGKADFGVYGYQAGLGYRFDFILSSDNFSTSNQQVFDNYGYGYGGPGSIPVVGDYAGTGTAAYGLYYSSNTASQYVFISPQTNQSVSETFLATDLALLEPLTILTKKVRGH